MRLPSCWVPAVASRKKLLRPLKMRQLPLRRKWRQLLMLPPVRLAMLPLRLATLSPTLPLLSRMPRRRKLRRKLRSSKS